MKKIKKYLYFLKLNELEELQRLRYTLAFMIAIQSTIIMGYIIKFEGLYFPAMLITFLLIIKNIINKFLDYITKKFILGQFFKILLVLHIIEVIVLFLYFYDKKLMIYVYSILDLFFLIFASGYSVKLTALFSKLFTDDMKEIQIFSINIWSEGYLIGLSLSFLLQMFFSEVIVFSVGIMVNTISIIYMFKNYNFYDYYFEKKEIKEKLNL
jgi:hypothetical protein